LGVWLEVTGDDNGWSIDGGLGAFDAISDAIGDAIEAVNEAVAEAAVVGMPHEIKGQGIYAFVTLKAGVEESDALLKELKTHVRKEIGPIATPDKIQFSDALPKTRSGKIMRRILTKIAAGDVENLGDTSTLADPSVVDILVKEGGSVQVGDTLLTLS